MILNVWLWPAEIVNGSDMPPTVKVVLLVVALVMVTLAPLAVKVPDAIPLVPTTTFPRFSVDGETASWAVAVVPLPDSGMARLGFVASDATVKLPLAVPAAVGAKLTSRMTACPAASVIGAVTPLRLKADPLNPSCEIVMLEPPVLVNVSDKLAVLPTVTLPKFSAAAEGVS